MYLPYTRSQHKWMVDNSMSDEPQWSKAYPLSSKYTKSARMMEFQLKFLHRRITTNDFQTIIGLENYPNGDFC